MKSSQTDSNFFYFFLIFLQKNLCIEKIHIVSKVHGKRCALKYITLATGGISNECPTPNRVLFIGVCTKRWECAPHRGLCVRSKCLINILMEHLI